ncbi:MAG: hypothetical protein CVU88_07205, partial [Firmicutes bacterium HGW-Firmicutes-13]
MKINKNAVLILIIGLFIMLTISFVNNTAFTQQSFSDYGFISDGQYHSNGYSKLSTEVKAELETNLDFGPETLEIIKKSKDVINTYGKIPEFTNLEQRMKWLDTLIRISNDINLDKSLFYPEGPVISYGVNYKGYLRVCILEGLTVENVLLNDIYSNVNRQGLREGVKEVPLVFSFEGLIKERNRFVKNRPIAGGVQVMNDGLGKSTLAYSAERNSDGMKGYVVSGHSFPNTGMQVWQPSKTSDSTYKAGKVGSVGGTYSDASFVPFSNVDGLVCIGLNNYREVIDFRDPYLGET